MILIFFLKVEKSAEAVGYECRDGAGVAAISKRSKRCHACCMRKNCNIIALNMILMFLLPFKINCVRIDFLQVQKQHATMEVRRPGHGATVLRNLQKNLKDPNRRTATKEAEEGVISPDARSRVQSILLSPRD